jgi:hypothetical protein
MNRAIECAPQTLLFYPTDASCALVFHVQVLLAILAAAFDLIAAHVVSVASDVPLANTKASDPLDPPGAAPLIEE